MTSILVNPSREDQSSPMHPIMTMRGPRTSIVSAAVLSVLALFTSLRGADDGVVTATGKVVGVHDGDTLTLLTERKKKIKVRLEGIDAPELGQAFGNNSKQSLSDLVFGRTVRIVISTTDDYGRQIAHVYVGDLWVNLMQVERGMAWQYVHYNRDARFRQAEAWARAHHAGLWQDGNPIPPWDYRHGRARK